MSYSTNENISIESLATPLVYRIDDTQGIPAAQTANPDQVSIRVMTRALQGMQKEAIVANGATGSFWRMVCDEGPYLNGTDLAPPPLAYFSAGTIACHASSILQRAGELKCDLENFEIVSDNRYSMEGSAAQGSMTAGALPVELKIKAKTQAGETVLKDLVSDAVLNSPVNSLMGDPLVNQFSISCNGTSISPDKVTLSPSKTPADPASIFDSLIYNPGKYPLQGIVKKPESTESVFESDHGAGASLKDKQKRILHLRTVLSLREDGLKQIKVQIFKPIGSVFEFLADDSVAFGGLERAPSGLAYLSAGIAFCFMTQLGRYASIVKKDLSYYGIVQDSRFDMVKCRTLPIDTHTFIITAEDRATVQKIIDMGEQTCFLHAACRASNPIKIEVERHTEKINSFESA